MSEFYNLAPLDANDKPFPFSELKGKAVLIVNVASKCGFTGQYADLETLYEKYKDRGLEVIGFPCNQFAGQEPGSAKEIADFCSTTYGVSFPVLKKINVNGSNADPVYVWLKKQKSGLLGFSGIKWNFEKFLIDPNGAVVNRWGSITNPSKLYEDIEKVLPKAEEKTDAEQTK